MHSSRGNHGPFLLLNNNLPYLGSPLTDNFQGQPLFSYSRDRDAKFCVAPC